MTTSEWLTTGEMGKLLGITGDAVKRRIYKGVYTKVKRTHGRGGRIWLVNINDPAIPEGVQAAWERHVEAVYNHSQSEGLKAIERRLDTIKALLEENTALLKGALKRQ